jgi:transcriptional regulator with GAF, ATPase, and Fis domain
MASPLPVKERDPQDRVSSLGIHLSRAMNEEPIWLCYCVGHDILPGRVVIESLSRNGLNSFLLNHSRPTGAGLLLFDRYTTELREVLREHSHNGLKRVLAVAVTRAMLTVAAVWELLQAGASDVFAWDQFDDAAAVIASRLERWEEVDDLVNSSAVRKNLVGQSPAWIFVLRRVVELARFTSGSALITGESGTGKEFVARLVHTLDSRPGKRDLVITDCTTIAPELAGSEFFGHERGAFTSAITARDGAFALADGGTLFLDEVGDLPLRLQAELLRVVQERTYKRVGSNVWKTTSFRLVCATNRDLSEEQAQGRFRRDFYYRIAAWTCRLPPLRERREDILPLARYFLRKYYAEQEPPDFDAAVSEFLITRAYPGNVRELRQVVTRMAQRHVGLGPITAGAIAEEDRATVTQKDWRDDGFGQAIRRALSLGIQLRGISDAAVETAIQIALEDGPTQRQAAIKLGVTDRALQMRRASRRKREQAGDGDAMGLRGR